MLPLLSLISASFAAVRDDCQNFVSIDGLYTNADCRTNCDNTNRCIEQYSQPDGCYGSMMYGYDQTNLQSGSSTSEESTFSTYNLPVGSSALDCQQLCQEHASCAFFAYRQTIRHGSHSCLLKSYDAIASALTSNSVDVCPPEVDSILICDGAPTGCVYPTTKYITGPKFCNEEKWMMQPSCSSISSWEHFESELVERSNLRTSRRSSDYEYTDEIKLVDACDHFGYITIGSSYSRLNKLDLQTGQSFAVEDSKYGFQRRRVNAIGFDSYTNAIYGYVTDGTDSRDLFALGLNADGETVVRTYPTSTVWGTTLPYMSAADVFNIGGSQPSEPGYYLGMVPSRIGNQFYMTKLFDTRGPPKGQKYIMEQVNYRASSYESRIAADFAFHPDSIDFEEAVWFSLGDDSVLRRGIVNFSTKSMTIDVIDKVDWNFDGKKSFTFLAEFFDTDGNLWAYDTSGKVYMVPIPDLDDPGAQLEGRLVSDTIQSSWIDGARCPFSKAIDRPFTTEEPATATATTTTSTTTTTSGPTTEMVDIEELITTTTTSGPTTEMVDIEELITTTQAQVGGFQCPDGSVQSSVQLEYVHVQDYSDSYKSFGPTMQAELETTFAELNAQFNGLAKFSIVRAIDKNLAQNGDFPCDDILTQLTIWGDDELANSLATMSDWAMYGINSARPDIFDAVLHQLDRWAGEGNPVDPVTGSRVIRIISTSTDQCPREAGLWYNIDTDRTSQWETDRGIHLPLTGAGLPDCQLHDYPSLYEVATEAYANDARLIFMVNGDVGRGCQDWKNYTSDEYDHYDPPTRSSITNWWTRATEIFTDAGNYVITRTDVEGDMENLADVIIESVTDLICTATTKEPIIVATDPVSTETVVGVMPTVVPDNPTVVRLMPTVVPDNRWIVGVMPTDVPDNPTVVGVMPTVNPGTSAPAAASTSEGDETNIGIITGSAVGGVLALGGAVASALMVTGIIPPFSRNSGLIAADDVQMMDTGIEREQVHEVDAEMFV